MKQPSALGERLAHAGRAAGLARVGQAAAAALCPAAVAEAVLRADGAVGVLPFAVMLALCTTVPVAFFATYPLPAALAVTAAELLTLPLATGPSLVGAVPALGLWLPLGLHRWRAAKAAASRRAESARAFEGTLLELTARGERARIARELHDVVAHHISMISVQAETARLTTPGLPPEGAARLLAIGDTARTALTEMRRLLGVLREDADGPEPGRRPQPGRGRLLDLLELVDENRATGGGRVRLIVHGAETPLDDGVALTAYRVVQEALTNARRHAPGAAVDVEVGYAPGQVRLRVRDMGPGLPPGPAAGGGHGLLGMRERVAAVGGSVRAGPAPGGGFVVEAALPAGAGP
ncbi:sensor histidine kinase [Streptomyces hoynatensis]|uniref:sensor histidine kinase n=1 Tax=Streptomyces hoynatensis TaxID=1141874 RepID=UPI0015777681|nr:histidine kinase [Streptomyces hoynatensis]